jgi:hypothetical protein
MLRRVLRLSLVATVLLTASGGCGSSKPTGTSTPPANVKGKASKEGTRQIRPPH